MIFKLNSSKYVFKSVSASCDWVTVLLLLLVVVVVVPFPRRD